MNTLISRLLVYIFNSYHQDVFFEMSMFLLEHLDCIEDMTVSEFAQECHTSLSTVKKFCNQLGYQDFTVMKQYLFSTINIRNKQIEERYKDLNIHKILEQIECIVGEMIDRETLLKKVTQIADDMNRAKIIYVIGANYPLALSLDFAEDMIVLKKTCLLKNVDDNIENLKGQNVYALLITITGRYFMLNKVKSQMIDDVNANFGLISQNSSILKKIGNVKTFLQLPGKSDSEFLNLIIVELLLAIRVIYYQKYILQNKQEKEDG